MAGFEPVLTIDFGLAGYGPEREPFRVRLDTGPLLDLVADARDAARPRADADRAAGRRVGRGSRSCSRRCRARAANSWRLSCQRTRRRWRPAGSRAWRV